MPYPENEHCYFPIYGYLFALIIRSLPTKLPEMEEIRVYKKDGMVPKYTGYVPREYAGYVKANFQYKSLKSKSI